MKVLITGANGMVARSAIKYCQTIGDEVLAFTRQQLDIADSKQVSNLLRREKPIAVINCAAYTDVDGSEKNVELCYRANSLGVENLALTCKEIDARFVTISTDYVFDGTIEDFYTQQDTPNPISVYGKAKLDGEVRAKKANSRSIIVRSGWIFGHHGTNFLSVMHNFLADGKNIKAIFDSFGTPTFADDLAVRLRQLAELDVPNVYHVTNSGDGTSYAGFAETVCEINGFDKKLLEFAASNSLKRAAPRPKNSKLACLFSEKIGLANLPNWKTSLQSFLRK
jgi:dTDP-4-dehydrorhamnose reductase